ncbi:uncharacterized protein LOC111053085 [Nilaparvata lugens]|uniref:uncharacterized protein LOC111053085 n=1 Tax=Nilaparvata lugens TaxID=108931 RepID=UPI00193CA1CF|nr:uncharacterized protein LOC111053085 [Nilaparvata lugens]XP_039275525.1 uncharacterized protein LOC111053085 [Nilaparvata lugens]XP_039275526.1 uncharacterized protein LOC111053085 [Nilaparvata lugens]
MSTIDFFTGQRKSTVPKKNYIKENINRLKRDKSASSKQTLSTKFGSVSSIGVENNFIKDKQVAPGFKLKLKDTFNIPLPNGPVPTGYRNQASQTVSEKDWDSIYHEGVIRYPSSRCASSCEGSIKVVREMGLQTERIVDRSPSPEPVDKTQLVFTKNAAGDLVKDHVKCNAMVQIGSKKKVDDAGDPTLPPPTYQKGRLPKYLIDLKKKQEKIKEEEEAKDPDCPPDHSLLPDEKRLITLEGLKKHYNSLLKELNSLPVRSDTLRTKKRRIELEKELEKVDAGMKLFSQDKLFVKKQS